MAVVLVVVMNDVGRGEVLTLFGEILSVVVVGGGHSEWKTTGGLFLSFTQRQTLSLSLPVNPVDYNKIRYD